MSEEAREFTGLSATEAAINACEEFGVNRSGIEYEVISEVGEGLDKQVVIKAKLKEGVEAGSANIPSDDDGRSREPRSRDRGDRGGRDRGGRDRDRGGRDRDRGQGADSRNQEWGRFRRIGQEQFHRSLGGQGR